MFGEVMRAVIFPKTPHVVHQSVVPIEPEVEDDAVETDFEGEPGPAHLRGGLTGAVAEEDGHDGPEGGGGYE